MTTLRTKEYSRIYDLPLIGGKEQAEYIGQLAPLAPELLYEVASNIQNPIYVTQPYMPPLQEFIPFLEEIWANKKLTNNGPFHKQLEDALARYLGVPYVSLFSNGTLALITALRALRIQGQVITTPYSFVATAHSLLWNGIEPVFVDIDPHTFNLDPVQIEAAITPHTTAIMPVHCYGRPCDVDAIQEVADKYGLRVIYDAAHAFGIRDQGGSLLRHGDLSVLSFHATKVFNTFEGGAIVCADENTKLHIDQLKNFGFVDEVTVVTGGINAKMCEVSAAFGLLQLKYVSKAIEQRGRLDAVYRRELEGAPGIDCIAEVPGVTSNYSYFPILIGADCPITRDQLYEKLQNANVFTRRYFFPLISNFPMYRSLSSSDPENLPVATETANRILCLPLFPDLSEREVMHICSLIRRAL